MTIEIFSVGHSRHEIAEFMAIVRHHAIDCIVDVRSVPSSRWSPQFNKTFLDEACRTLGMRYEWFGEQLGGRGEVSVTSTEFQVRMGEVIGIASHTRTAIMCSEGDPKDCHRAGKLFAWLHREPAAAEVKTTHILKDRTLVSGREFEPRIKKAERWHELDWSAPGQMPLL